MSRGLIAGNQKEASLTDFNGVYTLADMVNSNAEGIAPPSENRQITSLRNAGGIINHFDTVSIANLPDWAKGIRVVLGGTRLYALTDDGNHASIHEWVFETPYDINTLRWNQSKVLPVTPDHPDATIGEATPQRFDVNEAATVLLFYGTSQDDLVRYEFTTPGDVGTLTEHSRRFNYMTVSPLDFRFSPTGDKLWMMFSTSIYQHSLDSAYDIIQLGSYNSGTAWADSEGISNDWNSLAFSDDGKKLFINAGTNQFKNILEYDLRDSFDFAHETFVRAHNIAMPGHLISSAYNNFEIKSDGTKCYVSVTNSGVGQLDLDSAYNLSSYQTLTRSILHTNGDVNPGGLYVHPYGDRYWVIQDGTDYVPSIFEYKMLDSWQASSGKKSGKHAQFNWVGFTTDLFFKDDGTKLYILSDTSNGVYEFDLSTAWDITTATYRYRFYIGDKETNAQAMYFKPDGLELYITGLTGDDVNQFTLTNAWDLTTASWTAESTEHVATDVYGLAFNDDGTKLITVRNADLIQEHTLSTGWDITTMSAGGSTHNIVGAETTPRAARFKDDGTAFYVTGSNSDRLTRFNMTSAYDITTATASPGDSSSDDDNFTEGMYIDRNQEYYYTIENGSTQGFGGSVVRRYGTSNPGSLTADFADWEKMQVFDVSAQVSTVGSDVKLSDDGLYMYVLKNAEDLYQYNLTDSFDITTASYSQKLDLETEDTNIYGMCFADSGRQIVAVGRQNYISFWNLSTPWDISTATADSESTNILVGDRDWSCCWVSENGNKLYMGDETIGLIHQYDVPIPFRYNSINDSGGKSFYGASFNPIINTTSSPENPHGLNVSPAGDKLYVHLRNTAGIPNTTANRLHVFDMDSAYELRSVKHYKENFAEMYSNTIASLDDGCFTPAGNLVHTSWTSSYGHKLIEYKKDHDPMFEFDSLSYSPGVKNVMATLGGSLFGRGHRQNRIVTGQLPSNTDGFSTHVSEDGRKVFVMDARATVNEYTMSTPFDIHTMSYKGALHLGSYMETNYTGYNSAYNDLGFSMDPTGKHMYFLQTQGHDVFHFVLKDSFDLESGILSWDTYDVTTQSGDPRAAIVSRDGSQMYLIAKEDIWEYDLSQPYTVSTATVAADSANTLQYIHAGRAVTTGTSQGHSSSDGLSFGYGNGGMDYQVAILDDSSNSKGTIPRNRAMRSNKWQYFNNYDQDNYASLSANAPVWNAGFLMNDSCNFGIWFRQNSTVGEPTIYSSTFEIVETSPRQVRPLTDAAARTLRGSGWHPHEMPNENTITGHLHSTLNVGSTNNWYTTSATYYDRIYYTVDGSLGGYDYDFSTGATAGSYAQAATTGQYLNSGLTWSRDGYTVVCAGYNGYLSQGKVTTAFDPSTIVGLGDAKNWDNYQYYGPSVGCGDITFNDDGTLFFWMHHHLTVGDADGTKRYSSGIHVFQTKRPFDIKGMTRTGIVIQPPPIMNTEIDAQGRLANTIDCAKNFLFVVPVDIGDGTSGYRKMETYYYDLEQDPDILRF